MKLFAVVLSLFLLQSPVPTPKSTIEGTVVRVGSGEPISGAHITLARAEGAMTLGPTCPRTNGPPNLPSANTDGQGRYILKDVDACNYRVTAAANGYAKKDYGQRNLNGQGSSIALVPGQTTRNINIALTLVGNLSGHIRDNTGTPAVGVPVQLLRAVYNPDGQKELQIVESDKTNDRGEYRLYWITPGRYYLNAGSAAGPAGRRVLPGTGPVSPNQVTGEIFAYTLYPGVTDISQAVAIDIPAGSDIGGVDMTVFRQQLLNLRGRVVDPKTGMAPLKAEVVLYAQPSSGSSASYSGTYNPSDGSFEWTNISPGSYVIQAATPETVSVAPSGVVRSTFTRPINLARMPVELTNTDVEGVVVTLITGSTLPYRVKIDGVPTPAIADMLIRLRPSVNGAISSSANGISALNLIPVKNPDGSFRIDNVPPGEYRLSTVGLPEEFYLKEARYNSVDVLNHPLTYSATESGTMEVTVASGAARISGTALDPQSHTLAEIPVVLIPDQHRDRTELFLVATTDENGKFSIRGIPPGDYKLYEWDGQDRYSWFDPDLLKKYESQGKPVHVLESSNQTIDVKILN